MSPPCSAVDGPRTGVLLCLPQAPCPRNRMLALLLAAAQLEQYHKPLTALGITALDDLGTLTDSDLDPLGLTADEKDRLQRVRAGAWPLPPLNPVLTEDAARHEVIVHVADIAVVGKPVGVGPVPRRFLTAQLVCSGLIFAFSVAALLVVVVPQAILSANAGGGAVEAYKFARDFVLFGYVLMLAMLVIIPLQGTITGCGRWAVLSMWHLAGWVLYALSGISAAVLATAYVLSQTGVDLRSGFWLEIPLIAATALLCLASLSFLISVCVQTRKLTQWSCSSRVSPHGRGS